MCTSSSSKTEIKTLQGLPPELLLTIVSDIVTECLHKFWTKPPSGSRVRDLRDILSLLCVSYRMRDVTLLVLSDVLNITRSNSDRLQRLPFTTISNVQSAYYNAVTMLERRLKADKKIGPLADGTLGALYVSLGLIEREIPVKCLGCQNAEELYSFCDASRSKLERKMAAVQPNTLTCAVAPAVFNLQGQLQHLRECIGTYLELSACAKAMTEAASHPHRVLSYEDLNKCVNTIQAAKKKMVRWIGLKATGDENARLCISQNQPHLANAVRLLEAAVKRANTPALSLDDLFRKLDVTA